MNLELLESFCQNFPEDSDGCLDCISIALTCAFNRQGTLLVVGCNDGRLVIWDFLTRGIAKIISAHVHPVCTVSWSRTGYKILSAATDNTVCVWDVVSGESYRSFRFPSPVLKVQFHPRNVEMFLVCPMKHASLLMKLDGSHKDIPLDDDGDVNIVAAFDRKGKHIYTGNAKGMLLVFTTEDLKLVASFRITTGTSNSTAVRSIEFARRGNSFLVNAADRIIRVFESEEVLACGIGGEPEPVQKLQDLVNKTLWKKCCFSGDGEYVCAGSARQHALYIWEKSMGNLVKILHGTKGEVLLDVVWHPVRPVIASISSGVVSVWAQNQVENWSAFAPDFKELDENVEYEERESEFDLEDEDKEVEEAKGPQDVDEEVDVSSVEPVAAFVSSDEEGDADCLLYLPVSPEIDDPEEGGAEQSQEEATTPETTTKDKKRKTPTKAEASSSKRSKVKAVDINLPKAPTDEVHPMVNSKKGPDKITKRQPTTSASRSSKSGKGSNSKRQRDY